MRPATSPRHTAASRRGFHALSFAAVLALLSLSPAAQAVDIKLEVIKDLPSKYANSYLEELSRPVQAADGRIFIGTRRSLDLDCGELLAITPSTAVTAKVPLSRASQGCGVMAQLAVDPSGNVWGTTVSGAAHKKGALFRVPGTGGGAQTVRAYTPAQGSAAASLLAWPDGSLRLARPYAAVGQVIERLAPADYLVEPLRQFPDTTGLKFPSQIARLGSSGPLYGTGWSATSPSTRLLFSLDEANQVALLADISAHSPMGDLMDSGLGYFYIAATGGALGHGRVMTLAPNGNTTTLHQFTGAGGSGPTAPPVPGGDGWLYGSTQRGGAFDQGTLYRLRPDGSEHQVLLSFDGAAQGGDPKAGLLQARDGKFYGRTISGGHYNAGVLFRFKAPKAGS